MPAAITYFPSPPQHALRTGARGGWLEGALVRVTAGIARRPIPVVVGTLLLMVPCAWAYASIRVDTALLETFDADDAIAISTRPGLAGKTAC